MTSTTTFLIIVLALEATTSCTLNLFFFWTTCSVGSGKPWWKSKTLRPTHRPYRGSSNYSNYGGAGVGRFQPYPQRGGRPFRRGLSGGSFRGRGGYGQSPSGK
ncbi:hypothetical protein DPMN_062399 [Dreissena polymorpha]|uniref:Uncharacterized protein n=1 Tax=Dreissena polymorpha TaxID=45954 RepID=A0A9D4C8R4_DREPO|nr:hypothetical protein DPMN_062399 [Dreissena polymorpha]